MLIKEIMTTDVVSVSPETKISEISEILSTNRFHGVPVVENNKVIGLITESDFFLKNFDNIYFPTYLKFLEESRAKESLPEDLKSKIAELAEAKAADIMTGNPITFSPETDVVVLMEKIKETKFTSFPIVDEEKNLVGIVTLADYLGTVKKNSRQMKAGSSRNIDRLAGELGNFWQDKVVITSKKKVRTWKGLTFLGILTVVLLAFSVFFITKNQLSCNSTEDNSSSLECQQYSYTDWSACGPQKTQTREIVKRFPPNCSGGTVPILVQPCQ